MNALIKQEVKALRSMGYNSCCFYVNSNCYPGESFIECYTTGHIAIDVYSWEREVAGVGNDDRDWDVDSYDAKRITIPFERTRAGFRKAYRLARLCVSLPRKWRLY
ncbi:hypothetical protein M942_04670 [Enterobacter ludwigii]|uniref:hypothetical protein n=1 Tax=Enterobacter ludwigii TaxID=299767 RepID=UPI0003D7ECEF|nr:hypothetical protein [Enterobacter ludwigii]AHE72581.1 hypothetical protein M942_04670 [Enterobacter ludwigii]